MGSQAIFLYKQNPYFLDKVDLMLGIIIEEVLLRTYGEDLFATTINPTLGKIHC